MVTIDAVVALSHFDLGLDSIGKSIRMTFSPPRGKHITHPVGIMVHGDQLNAIGTLEKIVWGGSPEQYWLIISDVHEVLTFQDERLPQHYRVKEYELGETCLYEGWTLLAYEVECSSNVTGTDVLQSVS